MWLRITSGSPILWLRKCRDLVQVWYWSHSSSMNRSSIGERILVGDAHQRTAECRNAAVAGNISVLVWLRLAAGTMAVVGMTSQLCVTGCCMVWPNDVTPS